MHSAATKNSIVLNSSFLVAVCHRCHKGKFGESKKFHGSHHTIAVGFMQPLRFCSETLPLHLPLGKAMLPKKRSGNSLILLSLIRCRKREIPSGKIPKPRLRKRYNKATENNVSTFAFLPRQRALSPETVPAGTAGEENKQKNPKVAIWEAVQ